MDGVNIGVVGCGSVLHAYGRLIQALRFEGAVEVVAAADIDPSKLDHVREKWSHASVGTDYREVIASPEVDLVLVLTSMQEHGEIAKAALRAGKHVLVEKPMAMTLEEAAELVELAREAPGLPGLRAARRPQPDLPADLAPHPARRHRPGLLARGFYGWSGPWWGQWFYRRAAARCSTSASTTSPP